MAKMLIRQIPVAAYPVTKGFKFELEPGPFGKANFAFEDTPELRAALQEYNDGGLVSASQYSETIQLLKSVLYSYKQST
jgi:hypothetical protein